jgi:hypothetical protein
VVKFTETKSGMGWWWAGGTRRIRSFCSKDTEFQFCKTERVVEMDGGDGCTHNVNVPNATELYV